MIGQPLAKLLNTTHPGPQLFLLNDDIELFPPLLTVTSSGVTALMSKPAGE